MNLAMPLVRTVKRLIVHTLFLVQTPAQVSNITVSPSKFSATVMWEISTSTQHSSYITEIIIYLNGQVHKTVSRGTQVTIEGLLPYTSYSVGIQTQDGSSQKSQIVTKLFMTRGIGMYSYLISRDFNFALGKKSQIKVAWIKIPHKFTHAKLNTLVFKQFNNVFTNTINHMLEKVEIANVVIGTEELPLEEQFLKSSYVE
jgi:hypothetical protein